MAAVKVSDTDVNVALDQLEAAGNVIRLPVTTRQVLRNLTAAAELEGRLREVRAYARDLSRQSDAMLRAVAETLLDIVDGTPGDSA